MHCKDMDNRILRKSRLLVVLMMAIMLVLVSVTAQAQGRGQRAKHGSAPGARINLSPEQRAKFQKHNQDSRKKMKAVQSELRAARIELAEDLSKYDFNDQQVLSDVRKVNRLQKSMLELNLENQIKIRQILTKDQFADLREAIADRKGNRGSAGMGSEVDGLGQGEMESLRLSAEQKRKINDLWQKSRGNAQALRRKLITESDALHDLYMNYDLDQKDAQARINSLSNVQMQHLKAMIARQTEMRKILTKEQFQSLAKNIRPAGNRLRGGRK